MGKPVYLSILAEQISSYEHANKHAITKFPHYISIDTIRQIFENQDSEIFLQPNTNFTTDLECNYKALKDWSNAETLPLSPIHFPNLIRHHNLPFELTQVVPEQSLAFITAGDSANPLPAPSDLPGTLNRTSPPRGRDEGSCNRFEHLAATPVRIISWHRPCRATPIGAGVRSVQPYGQHPNSEIP